MLLLDYSVLHFLYISSLYVYSIQAEFWLLVRISFITMACSFILLNTVCVNPLTTSVPPYGK